MVETRENKESVANEEAEVSMRMYAIVAYFTIIVVIGVPLWWKTTEVYRVSLPYSRIETLASTPTKVRLKMYVISENYKEFEEELTKQLSSFDDCNISFEPYKSSTEIITRIKTAETKEEVVSIVDDVNVNQLLLIEYSKLERLVWFTNGRVILIKDAKEITISALSSALESWSLLQKGQTSGGGGKIFSGSAMHILMTVVVPKPEEMKVDWNSQLVMEQYIRPLADELKSVYNFTLKSQWLYLMELDFKAKQVPDDTRWERHYAVSEWRLTHVVTPLETKLAAQVALPPKDEALALLPTTLNLVLYVPPCHTSPIFFYNKKGKVIESDVPAFISPKWGGVVIANPTYETCSNFLNNMDSSETSLPTFKPKPLEMMGIFIAQLRQLLGFKELNNIQEVGVTPLRTVQPRRWELDALKRKITLEQIASAKLTLNSLAKLLAEISNIVINDDIGESVYRAIDNIEKSTLYLDEGQLDKALECSKKAYLAAETAFMDPSLLSLLYFPDDQKYAVYIPLFLPVMIPVLMSLKTMYSYLIQGTLKDKID